MKTMDRTEFHQKPLSAGDVEWIVNDLGELGVKIGNRCFFHYKGHSLDYGAVADDVSKEKGYVLHDDDSPMQYRRVGKREFGETVWPWSWMLAGRREDTYTASLNPSPANFSCDPLAMTGKIDDPLNQWQLLPTNKD